MNKFYKWYIVLMDVSTVVSFGWSLVSSPSVLSQTNSPEGR